MHTRRALFFDTHRHHRGTFWGVADSMQKLEPLEAPGAIRSRFRSLDIVVVCFQLIQSMGLKAKLSHDDPLQSSPLEQRDGENP